MPGLGLVPTFKNERNAIGSIFRSINDIYEKLNVEYRNHDVQNGYAVNNTAVILDLSQISTGVTGGNSTDGVLDVGYRIGDSVLAKSVYIKAKMRHNPVSAYATPVRVTLFRHYPGFSGDAPLDSELYDNATINDPVLDMPHRMQNLRHTKKYKIIATREFTLSDTASEQSIQRIEIFQKWSRSHIEWEGSSGTDPSNGKVYLHMVSGTSSNPPSITLASRLRYIDN